MSCTTLAMSTSSCYQWPVYSAVESAVGMLHISDAVWPQTRLGHRIRPYPDKAFLSWRFASLQLHVWFWSSQYLQVQKKLASDCNVTCRHECIRLTRDSLSLSQAGMFTGRTVRRLRTNWDSMCCKWKQVLMHIDHMCFYSQCVFLILAVTVSTYRALSTSTCLMYCLSSLPLLSSTLPLRCNNWLFSKMWRVYLSCQFISYLYDCFTYECYLTSIYKCAIGMAMGYMQEL